MSAQSPRLKRVLVSIAIAAGTAVGAAGIAAAASNTSTPSASTTSSSATDSQRQDPSYQSSVTIPEQANRSEADEAKALEVAARINSDQARQAALAAVPGTASNVSLENENGNVVYSVEVTANGTVTDVKVDAGNGTVLAKDTPDHEAGGAAEAPQSSTDAPETAGK
jgi:uncharacterized membrane protein YkoI